MKRIWVILLVLAMGTLFAATSYAEDAVCVFMSDKNNAWVVRRDAPDVKISLKVGDALYKGDTLVVTQGNKVQLAFDQQAENVMHIEGPTELQIDRINPTDIQLKQGKVFALLDKKGPASHFKVFAPTAIAAVRGTQFQVMARGQETQILTYRGQVEVNGRKASGEPTDESVILGPGQKTKTVSVGTAPAPTDLLSQSEQNEIGNIIGTVSETKTWMKGQDVQKWFAPKEGSSSSSSSSSSGNDSNTSTSKAGPIVF